MVMERERSCMICFVKVPNKEGHTHLSSMHIVKGRNKGEPMFLATIASLGENNGTVESLPPLIESP